VIVRNTGLENVKSWKNIFNIVYLRARLIIPNPDVGQQEFILLEVDREALDRYIAGL